MRPKSILSCFGEVTKVVRMQGRTYRNLIKLIQTVKENANI